ncbi:hypothetical protein [Halovivax sp.]|uniref:hypothetical protein n=1 Tax=Halovivax sp. TaxID=1935978 RepID=UPI0025C0E55D|nr:hypothetical protein [Halovivax sp.]
MGLYETLRTAVADLGPDEPAGERYVGAYWCDDCDVREPVGVGELDESDGRACPDCHAEMRLERSPDSGDCAC